MVIGLNSDQSIKQYKSALRPIVSEIERAKVLAALSSVDFIFIFEETNNNINIEQLKPDLYIKAGDYDQSKLSSAPLVQAYGGRILIVPFKEGSSTSGIVNRVFERYGMPANTFLPIEPYEKRPAVFFDRDGTLIEHVHYLHEPDKVKFFADGLAPLRRLQDAGYRIVMVTNQGGVGLGYFTKEDVYALRPQSLLGGLPSERFYDIVGKIAKRNIVKNQSLSEKDFG